MQRRARARRPSPEIGHPRAHRQNQLDRPIVLSNRLIYGSPDHTARRDALERRNTSHIYRRRVTLIHSEMDAATLARHARRDAANPPPYVRPPTLIIRRSVAKASDGSCLTRQEPLKREDLWVDGIGPPVQKAKRAHHQCNITKSHPVS
ncbi:hypothetical protein C8R43DRAFT_1143386 [Mycena crocata]|nr:hypothetical protein C8R43DRAFT_1143386 [Mycena crocata]